MGDNERHVKFNLRGSRRGDTFRIGFNQIGTTLEKRSDPDNAVFVEVGDPTSIYGDKYGSLSLDDAKQIIAKLQEVVDHYDNYRPVDALGLGAVVEYTGDGHTIKLFVNVGGSWSTTNGATNVSHSAVNGWLKQGTAVIRHEGYKSGGDN